MSVDGTGNDLSADELDDYDLSGEAGGEQPSTSGDPFFVSKQAAAVFKHRLLKDYFPKFAGKAGSTEHDKRLTYVDTHAGRGAYDDGTPGSPLLIAQNVAGMTQRKIDCLFIEARKSNHDHLVNVLARAMPTGAGWKAVRGKASDHLQDALTFAGDSPLFMFIDPYGLGLSFDEVVQVLNRPRKGFGSKTEVLLNFIAGAFGRAGGYLRLSSRIPQQESTLRRLDEVLGGQWWREVYLAFDSPSDAVARIAGRYAHEVAAKTGCRWTLIPVFDATQRLIYWLLHFTRHPDGQWWIREAASKASAEWRRHCNPPPAEDNGLFQLDDPFPKQEVAREAAWINGIEYNARKLLAECGVIDVAQDSRRLFGETFGLAWSKHLREALARLWKEGTLEPRPYAAGLDKFLGRRARS